MSQTTNINIRMDSQLKKEFEEFCQDVGISMSTAVTLFAKKTIQENKIPFIIARYIPNQATQQAMQETEDILVHPENYKQYKTVDDLFKEVIE